MLTETRNVVLAEGKSKDGKKVWPAGKFSVVVNVPQNEDDFRKLANGASSFDFARDMYADKAENAGKQAFKNASGDATQRISKAQEAATGYQLNSRGEGITAVAKAAKLHESALESMTDPVAREAFRALLAKANKED